MPEQEGTPLWCIAVQMERLGMKVADADQGTAIPAVTEPKLLSYTLRSCTSEVLGKDSKLPSQIILLKNMDDKRRLPHRIPWLYISLNALNTHWFSSPLNPSP